MEAQIIISILKVIIAEAPGAIAAIRKLVNTENPTDADYEAAKAQIKADTYGKLVSHSQLPQPGSASQSGKETNDEA